MSIIASFSRQKRKTKHSHRIKRGASLAIKSGGVFLEKRASRWADRATGMRQAWLSGLHHALPPRQHLLQLSWRPAQTRTMQARPPWPILCKARRMRSVHSHLRQTYTVWLVRCDRDGRLKRYDFGAPFPYRRHAYHDCLNDWRSYFVKGRRTQHGSFPTPGRETRQEPP